MSSTKQEKIAGIVGAAEKLPAAEREEFLVRECGGDEALLARARELLSRVENLPSIETPLFTDSDGGETVKELTISSVDFRKPDALIGQYLEGRYLIIKNLVDDGADKGGIGLVYMAQQRSLMGREVVVKILKEGALRDTELNRKFQHEQEALTRIRHPNIVGILDAGSLPDGNPFIVMEYIAGHSLRKLLSEKRTLSLDLIAHIIESITLALGAAHSNRVLHRDIKPENVMLTRQEGGFEHVQLIDFGVARVEESKFSPVTSVAGLVGTPYYMSPEQLTGGLQLTPASDIYATAIVAYELLTGEIPFKPKSVPEMYNLEKEGVQVPPRQIRNDLPESAEKILLSALEFETAKRPQDAIIFGREFALALRNNGNTASPFPNPLVDGTVPIDPANRTTIKQRYNFFPGPARGKKGLSRWLRAALLVAVLGIPAAYLGSRYLAPDDPPGPANANQLPGKNSNEASGPAPADAVPQRELSYYLTVEKKRNGKTVQTSPFGSAGGDVYESGDQFTMTFQSDAGGYMYIFNEGTDGLGAPAYYLLFPSPSVNDRQARISSGRAITTAKNTFGGGRGTETIWMIWTKEEQNDLAEIVRSVGKQGLVNTKGMDFLRGFIGKNRSDKTTVRKYPESPWVIVSAAGDTVVHHFELEHR